MEQIDIDLLNYLHERDKEKQIKTVSKNSEWQFLIKQLIYFLPIRLKNWASYAKIQFMEQMRKPSPEILQQTIGT